MEKSFLAREKAYIEDKNLNKPDSLLSNEIKIQYNKTIEKFLSHMRLVVLVLML